MNKWKYLFYIIQQILLKGVIILNRLLYIPYDSKVKPFPVI